MVALVFAGAQMISSIKLLINIILSLILFVLCTLPAHAEDIKDSAAWWLKSYGGVTAKDEPLVQRAEKVFDKVAAAADKNGKRFPRLVVINHARDPYAAAIRDGSIILTLGGLKLCYNKVSQGKGDSRLAFVLGHELAHSAHDDYWHAAAFEAVKSFATGSAEARKTLLNNLRDSAGEGNPAKTQELFKGKELQADSYGLLYMSMAGYDLKAVVDQDGTNFFQEWVTQIGGSATFEEPGHPGAKERTELFRAQLATVANDLDLFHFGVRLYQIGNYEDALLLLDRFREKFPSREVFSNIGLAWYQLALRELAICDPEAALRFKLPVIIDDKTLAGGFRARDAGSCWENDRFLRTLANAITHLELAVTKDPQYLPAQLNLASAYITANEFSKAMASADAALKIAPDNSQAMNAKAVALYLFGRTNNIDTTDTVLNMLKEAALLHPASADSLYNKATIAFERDRTATAKDAGAAFLELEPSGRHATSIRKRFNIAENVQLKPQAKPMASPLALGEIGKETAAQLKAGTKSNYSLGRTDVIVYDLKGLRALSINGSIELVVTTSEAPIDLNEFKREFGEPLRVETSTSGSVLVYKSGAADLRDGKISNLLFFESR